MKTIAIKFLLTFLILISLQGCRATKKTSEKIIEVENNQNTRDSTKTTQINKAIYDTIITPVVKSVSDNALLDSIVNARVDEILSKLSTSKSSGDNSYTLSYDKLKRQLDFFLRVGQTKNENSKVSKNSTKTVVQIKQVPIVTVKPLSKIERILMGAGILALLFLGFRALLFIRGKTKLWW